MENNNGISEKLSEPVRIRVDTAVLEFSEKFAQSFSERTGKKLLKTDVLRACILVGVEGVPDHFGHMVSFGVSPRRTVEEAAIDAAPQIFKLGLEAYKQRSSNQ